jgi:hypothetical protein
LKEEGSHQPKSTSVKPTSNEVNDLIKVELLSDKAIQDGKS